MASNKLKTVYFLKRFLNDIAKIKDVLFKKYLAKKINEKDFFQAITQLSNFEHKITSRFCVYSSAESHIDFKTFAYTLDHLQLKLWDFKYHYGLVNE